MLPERITHDKAEEIYILHCGYVYRTALVLTKSKTLAEDAVQETFLRVFQKFHMYDNEKPLLPWIYKITVNVSRNILRKQRWLSFVGDAPEGESAESVELSILKNDEERELWRAVNELPLKHREIIILHYYCDMKLKDIAGILSIPLGTCKSRLNSALKALRASTGWINGLEGGFADGRF